MSLNDYDYERIERYLLQEMDAAERQAFEADCQANPALAEALQKEKQVHLLIRIHNQSLIRQQVRNLDAGQKAQEAAPPTLRRKPFFLQRRVILLAGSIAAILLVSIGFFWQANGDLEGGLFSRTRGKPATGHTILDSLQAAENEENWTQVEQLYATLPDSLKGRLSPTLQLARAKYQLGKYKDAEALARKVMDKAPDAKNEIGCRAKLLLVLIYRKTEQREAAKILIGKADTEEWSCLSDEQLNDLKEILEE